MATLHFHTASSQTRRTGLNAKVPDMVAEGAEQEGEKKRGNGHMGLKDAHCFAFNQGNRSNKAEEQKHVTICHMPLGHKLSSRYTLGCVRPGGTTAAASLGQVPSCPRLSPWDQPPKCPQSDVFDDLTCDPPIWKDGLLERAA
ncbi:hypothetical protein PAMA_003727 [Pampus argenteus]